ncbi:unnamed protein product [Amoebophrya sp. A120]|nr:unnamed protein product [Amoebophrya sp. A120]|eukprot:GSA120T00024508001.1
MLRAKFSTFLSDVCSTVGCFFQAIYTPTESDKQLFLFLKQIYCSFDFSNYFLFLENVRRFCATSSGGKNDGNDHRKRQQSTATQARMSSFTQPTTGNKPSSSHSISTGDEKTRNHLLVHQQGDLREQFNRPFTKNPSSKEQLLLSCPDSPETDESVSIMADNTPKTPTQAWTAPPKTSAGKNIEPSSAASSNIVYNDERYSPNATTNNNQKSSQKSTPSGYGNDDMIRSSSSVRYRQGGHPRLFENIGRTHGQSVDGLLTDFYQITMAYAYWKAGKHEQRAVFDAYFRKCPFKGEYCICAGINETVRFLNTFGYSDKQIDYLKIQMPTAQPEFFDYLAQLDASELTVMGMREGEIVFPNQPLLRLEGPLIVCQLLETTVLNLLNYPSLIATNAARYRQAATSGVTASQAGQTPSARASMSQRSPNERVNTSNAPMGNAPVLIEMGCRRAQGPDGALSAARYSYLGGFDATSNVKAGHVFDVPIKGTHAHAFVTSFNSLDEVKRINCGKLGDKFVSDVLSYRPKIAPQSNDGELAAFVSYATSFPDTFLALVDTYDTLISGIPNFLCVALALLDRGHKPVGVRLDSGDLAYLSKEAKEMFRECSDGPHCKTVEVQEALLTLKVCASNDINEVTLQSLNEQGHGIDIYGIGTNLVTCQAQPALGMVYKLVELDGDPRMKLSQEFSKVSVPSKKKVYRLYNSKEEPLIDLMQRESEAPPKAGDRIFCRHLFEETKRCYVTPTRVEELLHEVWGRTPCVPMTLDEAREFSMNRLARFRPDILRPLNPTQYKLAVSDPFFGFFKQMWQKSAPIKELT